jgi:hypothetical protein
MMKVKEDGGMAHSPGLPRSRGCQPLCLSCRRTTATHRREEFGEGGDGRALGSRGGDRLFGVVVGCVTFGQGVFKIPNSSTGPTFYRSEEGCGASDAIK